MSALCRCTHPLKHRKLTKLTFKTILVDFKILNSLGEVIVDSQTKSGGYTDYYLINIIAKITPYLDFGHDNLAILAGVLFSFSSEFLSDIF